MICQENMALMRRFKSCTMRFGTDFMRISDAAIISLLPTMERSAAAVHLDMKRGLNSLVTIVSIAPMVGIFGTVLGIVYSFTGGYGEKSAALAGIMRSLSEAMWPTAMGVVI